MSIVKSEFALALNQVATERGISVDDVISSIEAAILAAYHKEFPETVEDETLKINVNRDTGEAHVLKDDQDITPPGFGRIAAQTAKQVTLQKIREVEKQTVLSQYKSQMGSIIRGRVIRYDGFNAYIDIGKIEAVLPREEQIKNEKYSVNDSLVFYLKEISEDKFGNSRIIVSRTDPNLIVELFKKEVPEIASGTVEIKKVAREPGERAKIAVFSSQGGVDPVGACVGQKGVRVQTVTNELGGSEKIDIIQWNSDEKLFLIAALSPAQIKEVSIENGKAQVTVEEDQAPLAIGKNGINVNLASRLAGFEIDIVQVPSTKKQEEVVEEVKPEEKKDEAKAKKTAQSEAVEQVAETPQEAPAEALESEAPQPGPIKPETTPVETQTAQTDQQEKATPNHPQVSAEKPVEEKPSE